MSNPIHILYFFLTALFWGGSFLAIKIAITHYPPFFSAFLRVLISTLFISFYLLIKNKKIERPKVWLQSMGSGLFAMGIPFLFLFWGEQFVNPAVGAIINSTVPIFTTLLLPLITPQDRWTWKKIIGVTIGFVGVLIIFAPEIKSGPNPALKGMLAITGMAVCYAISILWMRRISNCVRASVNIFYQSLGGTILLFLSTILFELPSQKIVWSLHGTLAVLYLGIMSTALAWLMFFRLVREMGSVQASAVSYMIPLVAIVLDILFLGQWIQSNQAIGVVIILLGIFLIQAPMIMQKKISPKGKKRE